VLTGNPVRKDILTVVSKRDRALAHFGFDPSVMTLLIVGGSLGARTINESIIQGIDKLAASGFQLIWQTGKGYYDAYKARLDKHDLSRIRVQDFVKEMDLAYAAADVVISRAGAIAVSEICIAGKPVILVPSPNVAEDHQTKNAQALVSKDAAVLVKDVDAARTLVDAALSLMHDSPRRATLSANILKLAKPDATAEIVNEIEGMINSALQAGSSSRAKTATENEAGRQLNATALVPVPVKVNVKR
jgi:UDP-N-acetylglucosamine--N-acetylmuramyl-(pentapeptide) pyrophosphoryl-undecaprenol N-acetylglucosamine transferase